MNLNKKAQFFPLRDENLTTGISFVNWILIAANIIIFIYSLQNLEYFVTTYGFTPAEFSFITLLTSMFLHGGFAHLFGNMWFLYIFGDNVEDTLGHIGYLVFYFVSGIVATLTHYLLNLSSTIPAVGASGAISGVLGAYIVLFPRAGVYVSGGLHIGRVPAVVMIGLWFLFQLISGALSLFGQQSGIAFFAHIGGFVFGAVAAAIYKGVSRKAINY